MTKTIETWLGFILFVAFLLAGIVATGENKRDGYDPRDWACAEYDLERICTRLERTVNK